MRDDLRNEMARARDEFLTSTEGRQALDGNVTGAYLRNRMELAFLRGYEAARRDAWIQRSCGSKTRHGSEAAALSSAAHIASKKRIRGLHAYRCPICKGWHLTKQERRNG
jgi:hypothetical protein